MTLFGCENSIQRTLRVDLHKECVQFYIYMGVIIIIKIHDFWQLASVAGGVLIFTLVY